MLENGVRPNVVWGKAYGAGVSYPSDTLIGKNGLNQIVPSYLASYAIVDAGRPSTRQNKLTISNWALTIRTYLDGA